MIALTENEFIAEFVQKYKIDEARDYTTGEVQKLFGLSKATIVRYIKDGTLIGVLMGNRWLVTGESLVKYLKDRLSITRHRSSYGSELLLLTQVAEKLGISDRTVYRWHAQRKINVVAIHDRPYVTTQELKRLQEARIVRTSVDTNKVLV